MLKSRKCKTLARSAYVMLPITLLLAGCATTRTVTKPVPDCSAWTFITTGNDDALTNATAVQIVTNDKNWLKLCGKPKP